MRRSWQRLGRSVRAHGRQATGFGESRISGTMFAASTSPAASPLSLLGRRGVRRGSVGLSGGMMVMTMVVMRMLARRFAEEGRPTQKQNGEQNEGAQQDKDHSRRPTRRVEGRVDLIQIELGENRVWAAHLRLTLSSGGRLLDRFRVARNREALHPVAERMAADLQAVGGFCQVEVVLLQQRGNEFAFVAGHDLIQ